MSQTTGKKKFSLILEPHGSYEKYVVCFDYDEKTGYKFSKIPFRDNSQLSKLRGVKYSLPEIDIFTSEVFNDNIDLFRKLSLYQQVHNIYIQFSDKQYFRRVSPIYDEDLVIDKLGCIKGDKVVDKDQIEEYIQMLIDDNIFFSTFMQDNIYKTKTVLGLVRDLKRVSVYVEQTGGSDESREYLSYCKNQLKEELSKYHIFRGVVIAEAKAFEIKKQKEESRVQKENDDKPKVYAKRPVYPGYQPKEYNQITLPGFEE